MKHCLKKKEIQLEIESLIELVANQKLCYGYDSIKEALSDLRISIEFLMHDLESTRRERDSGRTREED